MTLVQMAGLAAHTHGPEKLWLKSVSQKYSYKGVGNIATYFKLIYLYLFNLSVYNTVVRVQRHGLYLIGFSPLIVKS